MAIGIGTALIGGALIGGLSSMSAANKQAKAAKSAAAMQAAAGEQARADLAPWRGVGEAALYEMSALMGLPGDYPGRTIDTTAREVPQGNAMYPGGTPGFNEFAGKVIPMSGVMPKNMLAAYGRNGDTAVGHLTPGETVVPQQVMQRDPGLRNRLAQAYGRAGTNIGRYTVGGSDDSINPATGMREFAYAGAPDGRTGFEGSPEMGGRTSYGGNPRDASEGGRGINVGGLPERYRNMMFPNLSTPQPTGQTPPMSAPGLPDDYYTRDAAMGRFNASPDYQFRMNEGIRALDASAAARGGLFSGNQGRAITEYGQNLASGEYGNYWNRLAALAGAGQSSAAQQGNFGMQTAANAGNAVYNAGQAQAGGIAGVGSALNSGINNYLFYQAMQNGAFG